MTTDDGRALINVLLVNNKQKLFKSTTQVIRRRNKALWNGFTTISYNLKPKPIPWSFIFQKTIIFIMDLINVEITEQKYLFNTTNTFLELKFSILKETGLLIDRFYFEDNILSHDIKPINFSGKLIKTAISDQNKYQVHGKNKDSFRCSVCYSSLNKTTFKCKHTDSCRRKQSRNNISVNVSSIEENNSNFIDDSIDYLVR